MVEKLVRRASARRDMPRTFGSYVARALVPRSILFAAVAAALLVSQEMAVDPLAERPDVPTAPAITTPAP